MPNSADIIDVHAVIQYREIMNKTEPTKYESLIML